MERHEEAPLLVAYVGNDPSAADAFERWLGRPLDGVQLHSGRAGWDDWAGSISWLIDRWAGEDRLVFWSIPLIPEGADLASAAAGAFDSRYTEAGRRLADATLTGPIFLRTGWEFNGDWQPWAAAGRERAYVDAFRRFVVAFRSASDRFVFEWSPNIGTLEMNPEDAYPGDAYVDIIGLDFYYFPDWDGTDPEAAWTHMLNRPYGLAWHQAFAANRGKPTAYSEWGVMRDDAGIYIDRAGDWFRSHGVVYQSYWNSDADFAGKLSGGAMPAAGAAFRKNFAAGE